MKTDILDSYKEWKSDKKHRYELTDLDRRVANIAAMYSESEMRHATVMRAAHNRMSKQAPSQNTAA